ncbi:MAG TPA: hypothetical protein VIZ65_01175 [Cellvibrionaceae bacterium]
MSIFEPVTLEYKGVKKTIPANRVMYLASIIELNFKPVETAHARTLPSATMAIVAKPMLEYAGFAEIQPSLGLELEDLAIYFASNPAQVHLFTGLCFEILHKLIPPKELTGEENTPVEAGAESGKKPTEAVGLSAP